MKIMFGILFLNLLTNYVYTSNQCTDNVPTNLVPCTLLVQTSIAMLGYCTSELSDVCCLSCKNHHPKFDNICQDTREDCASDAEAAFSKFGQCPPSLAKSCCSSCSAQMLNSTGPCTKDLLTKTTSMNTNNSMCENLPTHGGDSCQDIVTDAKRIFGECPVLLNIVCCASCANKDGASDVCQDDETWTDFLYGDATSKCIDLTDDWCKNYGDYSTDAQLACPKSCGLCTGSGSSDNTNSGGKKPVGPVHPDNIPLHPDNKSPDTSDTTSGGSSNAVINLECVNDLSSLDRQRNDCSWYTEARKKECGKHDIGGHRFTSSSQCCVCRNDAFIMHSPYYEQNVNNPSEGEDSATHDNLFSNFDRWLESQSMEHLIILGALIGLSLISMIYCCFNVCMQNTHQSPYLTHLNLDMLQEERRKRQQLETENNLSFNHKALFPND